MAKSYDYQSAFDIIGPVMMGPSSSHTAGAVKIGNSARAILGNILKILKYIIMNHLLKHTKDMVQMSLLWVEQWAIQHLITELNLH